MPRTEWLPLGWAELGLKAGLGFSPYQGLWAESCVCLVLLRPRRTAQAWLWAPEVNHRELLPEGICTKFHLHPQWQPRAAWGPLGRPWRWFHSFKSLFTVVPPRICCPRTAGCSSQKSDWRQEPLGLSPDDVQGYFASSPDRREQAPMSKSQLPYRDGKCSYPEFWLGPTFYCTHCWDNFAKHWAHPAGWFPQVPARMNKEKK